MTTYTIKQERKDDRGDWRYQALIGDSIVGTDLLYDDAWDSCAAVMRPGDKLMEIHGNKVLNLDYVQVQRIQAQLQELVIFDEV